MKLPRQFGSMGFIGLVTLFFVAFLIVPLFGVFQKTFFFNGSFSIDIFLQTIASPIVTQAMFNSLSLGVVTVILCIIIALPLAWFVSEYDFKFKRITSALILVPMILPPFVGAIGIKRIFARYGVFNMFFGTEPFDWLSQTGFLGVALLLALHLFPIMYLNLTAALSNIDPRLREAAQISGASQKKVFWDITVPLAAPGFISGAVIVFLWSITDLGTPLILGFRKVLAIEIFDRSVSINNDPTGPAMVVLVVLITIVTMFLFKRFFNDDTLSSASKGFGSSDLKKASPLQNVIILGFSLLILALALMPHLGLILTSIAGDWFMTALPDRYTWDFFSEAIQSDGVGLSISNSLYYSSISTLIDVVLGVTLAYYLLKKKLRLGWLIDSIIMLPIALPGIVLAFGYVAAFSGTILDPLKNPVPLLIIGYAVRRLPYCFRAAYAGLQQIGIQFEEAGRVCGATRIKTLSTITVPLIWANIIAGAILAFMFAMLEVSESMILAVKKEFYPVTRAIYDLFGKIPDGDYVAAALGVLCMIFLATGIALSSMLLGKQMGKMFRV